MGLQRREIGLYEAGSVGVLLGLKMGMILAVFQMLGIESRAISQQTFTSFLSH